MLDRDAQVAGRPVGAAPTTSCGASPNQTSGESSPRNAVAMDHPSRALVSMVTRNSRRRPVKWKDRAGPSMTGLSPHRGPPHDGRIVSV